MISQGWYVAGLLAFGWVLTLLAWAWLELGTTCWHKWTTPNNALFQRCVKCDKLRCF